MFQLLKYEFRKTRTMKLVLFGITAVAEVLLLIGLYGNKNNLLATGAGVLFLTGLCGELLIGLQSIITLHRDMNTKQGYMLFMTPHSSCSILGAKVLECGLSIILTGAFYLLLGYLDVRLIMGKAINIKMITDYFTTMVRQFNEQIPLDINGISALVFQLLASWIALVTTAFLSDVIASSLLNGKRVNGLITFLIFIGLNALQGYEHLLIPANVSMITSMLIAGGISLVFAVIMYVITFKLMDRYLSV